MLAPLSVGRNRPGGAAVGGKLYAMGEQRLYDEYHGNYDVVEGYDPATDAWTRMAPLPKAIGHTTPGVFAHAEIGGLFVLGGTTNKPDSDATVYAQVANHWYKGKVELTLGVKQPADVLHRSPLVSPRKQTSRHFRSITIV